MKKIVISLFACATLAACKGNQTNVAEISGQKLCDCQNSKDIAAKKTELTKLEAATDSASVENAKAVFAQIIELKNQNVKACLDEATIKQMMAVTGAEALDKFNKEQRAAMAKKCPDLVEAVLGK